MSSLDILGVGMGVGKAATVRSNNSASEKTTRIRLRPYKSASEKHLDGAYKSEHLQGPRPVSLVNYGRFWGYTCLAGRTGSFGSERTSSVYDRLP